MLKIHLLYFERQTSDSISINRIWRGYTFACRNTHRILGIWNCHLTQRSKINKIHLRKFTLYSQRSWAGVMALLYEVIGDPGSFYVFAPSFQRGYTSLHGSQWFTITYSQQPVMECECVTTHFPFRETIWKVHLPLPLHPIAWNLTT